MTVEKKTAAYFDCFSGASGDMILAALLDAGLHLEQLQSELAKLGLNNVEIVAKRLLKNHISATTFEVIDKGNQPLRHLKDLVAIVEQAELADHIKSQAIEIFGRVAEAEASVHGQPLEKVHFHEIGAVDTIIDVVGALIAFDLLGIRDVFCSKLNVGSGFVTFSHGTFPVPAPATSALLKGVPIYSDGTQAELVTPTGAAILSQVVKDFGDMPEISAHAIGYGAGQKDLPRPNVLRVFLGEASTAGAEQDKVSIIETNIDDMNPQFYQSVMDNLLSAGALDVFLTSTIMKKGRPGLLLTALCPVEKEVELVDRILRETTSIGVRIRQERRVKLEREIVNLKTELGNVRVKVTRWHGKIANRTPEFEDCKRIAEEKGLTLKEVYRKINAAL